MDKKKVLLIVLPIVLLVIIAGVMSVLVFATDSFKSNQELFLRSFSQNKDLLDIIENENINIQNQWKKANSYQSNGELTVTYDNGTNNQAINLKTITKHNSSNNRTYSEIALKKDDADLLKVSYVNCDDIYAVKCDDILGNYIGVQNRDLQLFAKKMGLGDAEIANIPNVLDLESIENIGKITAEEKQHIMNTYFKVIADTISKDKYSKLEKQQVSVDGKNYETNAYQVTLDVATVKQIALNCLTTLKSDNTTLVMLSNLLSGLGINSEYTDITNMNKAIDQIISEIPTQIDNNQIAINVTVYENNANLLKTVIEIQNQGTITINHINSNNGNQKEMTIIIETKKTDNTNTSLEAGNLTQPIQVTLGKTITETGSITAKKGITIGVNNKTQNLMITSTIGKIQNNATTNSSTVEITGGLDENSTETISSSYVQNIQMTQVDDIPELNSTNTVIINNYAKQQLIPVLTVIGNKAQQVFTNKIGQLGITTIQGNQGNNNGNLMNATNELYKMISMLGTAGVSIANTNGIEIERMATAGIVGVGAYIYNQASNSAQLETGETDLSKMKVETFNAVFTPYEGEINGSKAKSLCDAVKNHNLSFRDNITEQVVIQMSSAVGITTEPTNEVQMATIEEIKKKIQNTKQYTVDFGYSNTTGQIVAIGITEK